jgi:hypothetical protein
MGKKKAAEVEEKPASIDDAMLHNTKGVSAEEAFKRTAQSEPQGIPTPVQRAPMSDDDDLFADFPMFGGDTTRKEEPAPAQPPPQPPDQPVQEESAPPMPSLDDAPPQPAPESRFRPAHTEQFAESLNDEVPDLMDVPQNTSVDVKIRGDVGEIPEASAPEPDYNVQNVEFASPTMETEQPIVAEPEKEGTLLNYIVKKGKGRMELFIELHDMRKLTDDIDNLSAIEKKSDHGFAQVNEIHEHEKKLLANLRKSLEDMHRQFNLMDALIFENDENR